MSAFEDHRLRLVAEDEAFERERREDRIAAYTPVQPLPPRIPAGPGCSVPRLSSAMTALAWTVIYEDEHEEAARALAQLVLGTQP